MSPLPELRAVPPRAAIPELVETVRGTIRIGVAEPLTSFTPLSRRGRFRVRTTRLSAAEGAQQGLLVPLQDDRFSISVDPEPQGGWGRIAPRVRSVLKHHRTRFLVAHEVAHTLFYKRVRGSIPVTDIRASRELEDFCDQFARALLVPPSAVAAKVPDASAVFCLHERYGVSVELAARALAAHHGLPVGVWFWLKGNGPRSLRRQWVSARGVPSARDLVTEAGDWEALAARVSIARPDGLSVVVDPERRQVVAVQA